jgi:hypothetical protein
MPAFWLDMSQIATNHFLSSRWVPSIIVPAVTLNWREHFVHCHLWACPCTLEQVRFPHAGQTKPPGCFSSRSLLSHDSSSGYLSRNSRSVPLLSHSFLLSPPAWPFAIASSALPDASAVHPYDAAERRQEFLRLCRRSSAIFSYYELGEPLFEEHENNDLLPFVNKADMPLNQSLSRNDAMRYVWYTETKSAYVDHTDEHPYLMGQVNDTVYYLAWEPDRATTLSYELLRTLPVRGTTTVIYADRCVLDQPTLEKLGIRFKQIPRQIARM